MRLKNLNNFEQFFSEDFLNVFKADPDFEANEAKYESVKKGLLGEDDSSGSGSGNSGSKDSGAKDESGKEVTSAPIVDETETNLRRIIYLTIMVSVLTSFFDNYFIAIVTVND